MNLQNSNHVLIRIQPHTVLLVIGGNGTHRKNKANELYHCLQQKTPYVKNISLDEEANWLADGDSEQELEYAARSAIEPVLSRLNITTSSPIPPLAVVVHGSFSTDDVRKIVLLCKKTNYEMHLIAVEPCDEPSNNNDTLLSGWRYETCAQIFATWESSKVRISHTAYPLITLPLNKWKECQLSPRNWWIVGDIHGCFSEFIELLEKGIGWKVTDGLLHMGDGDGLILVGNLIGSGKGSKDVIEFINRNINAGCEIRIVAGNNDVENLNCLDNLPQTIDPEHFTVVSQLQNDNDMAHTFRSLMEHITPFVQYITGNSSITSFIVTHSICPHRYRARIDNNSINHQKYLSDPILTYQGIVVDENTDPILERLRIGGYIGSVDYNSALFGEPIHYSGHLTIRDVYFNQDDSVVLLNTGCVFGGSLSAIRHSDKKIVQVAAHHNADVQITPTLKPNIPSHADVDKITQLMLDYEEIIPTLPDSKPNTPVAGSICHLTSSSTYHICPPNAGFIECSLTALRHFAASKVTDVFAFTIPNGKNIRLEIRAGILPEGLPARLTTIHAQFQQMMLTYKIDIMHVDTIKEVPAIYPHYKAGIKHIERLLQSNAENTLLPNTLSELSLGKMLELYQRADSISSKASNMCKNGRYHLVDINYVKFKDGEEWSYGKVIGKWNNPKWRRKILHREGHHGSILDSAILKIHDDNAIEASYKRVENMLTSVREAFAIVLQSASESVNNAFMVHTAQGMLLKYGPLNMCNSEYIKAVNKFG
jgi:hypothetical protein